MALDKKERAALIRKGNELFNNGEIDKATEIFVMTGYKDGIARVADHHYYDKKAPLIAFKFYKMASMQDKVDEIFARMVFALSKWVGEDKVKDDSLPPKEESQPIKISPKLKILAEEILRDNENKQQSEDPDK